MSSSQRRIAGALLAGAALIAGALLIRAYSNKNNSPTEGVAVVVTTPKRVAIKTLDENNDGVPDWQEALLLTDPLDMASTTSQYKEPETLTEQFALEFFQDAVRSKNNGPFGATSEELVGNASDKLIQLATDELYTTEDIIISTDTSLDALSKYGEIIAEITTRYSDTSSENEVLILERAIREQNPEELKVLDGKILVYENILKDTLVLAVPMSLQTEHLNLLNSYQAIVSDIKAMRNAFVDPMLSLLRTKRYREDAEGLTTSFINIYTKLQNSGATWDADSPVYLFIQ